MQDKYSIKLSETEYGGQKIKGAFLTLQEYALLRNIPYQAVVEEVNETNNRKKFHKTIYHPELKSIFVYGEKPLYSYTDAILFRKELMSENPNKKYEIQIHPTENIKGFWLSKKEYLLLTHQNTIAKNKIEFGQLFEKTEKGYNFFIPTEPEPYTYLDLQMLLTQLELKKQKSQIAEIKLEDIKVQVTEIGKLLRDNPNLISTLEELACLSDEELYSLKEILILLSPGDIKKIKIIADGYTKLFK